MRATTTMVINKACIMSHVKVNIFVVITMRILFIKKLLSLYWFIQKPFESPPIHKDKIMMVAVATSITE